MKEGVVSNPHVLKLKEQYQNMGSELGMNQKMSMVKGNAMEMSNEVRIKGKGPRLADKDAI